MKEFMEKGLGLILKAASFAATAHRDQRRKDPLQTPYINHPLQVAELLYSVGGVRDVAILAAALLHDTIEDTAVTQDDIEKEFGPEITLLVIEVTDDKTLPKAERKRLQVETAATKSRLAKMLKIADKSCNLASMGVDSPTGWNMERKWAYLEWAKQVVDGSRGENESLDRHFDGVFRETARRLRN